jgi:hypothetical protein
MHLRKWVLGPALAIAASAAAAAGMAAPGPAALASSRPAAASSQVCGSDAGQSQHRYDHVIWIWMENHSYNTIIGSSAAPFANQLASECGLAANYHNITHPSAPEYLAATSGELGGAGDCTPSQCPDSHYNIFQQATQHGLSWADFAGGMSSLANDTSLAPQYRTATCAQGDPGSGYNPPYDVNHNPAVYYTDINPQLENPSAAAGPCQANDLNLGSPTSGPFAKALATDLPSFTFIGPNLCDDTHNCTVAHGDEYLQSLVGAITSSAYYKSGDTAVFLAWDEGEGGVSTNCAYNTTDIGCHVATIVISPTTVPGTVSNTLFNHYSLLKTTEQLLGLPLIGHAKDTQVNSMLSDFGL